MALKDAWNALIGKSNSTEIAPKEDQTALVPMASEAFPVVKVQPDQLAVGGIKRSLWQVLLRLVQHSPSCRKVRGQLCRRSRRMSGRRKLCSWE